MTNLQALQSEIEPYTASQNALEKALADNSVTSSATYTSSDKVSIAKAAISVLNRFLSLSSESQGGFSQGYSPSDLRSRIQQIATDNGLGTQNSTPSITSKSQMW